MNAPVWLKCENCLWWKSAGEPGEGWGCTYAGIPKPMTAFDRCHLWTCKRCFSPWNVMVYDGDDVVNHLYCKRLGRGRAKPEAEHDRAEMEPNPFNDPEFQRAYDALIKKICRRKGME